MGNPVDSSGNPVARQLVDKNLLREPINHEAYKQSFKDLFQSYMQTHNPWTRVLILNTKTQNSTTLKKVYSDGKGC